MKKTQDEDRRCTHPEHTPPTHMVRKPGTHVHTCPSCGKTITFTISGVQWDSIPRYSWTGQLPESGWIRRK